MIRRAVPADEDILLVLIGEFCQIDRHPFDRSGCWPAFARCWLVTSSGRCG